MPTAVTTTTTELPGSRVRLEAEVGPDEIRRSLDKTAARLGRDLKLPGFRKGKVPTTVVLQRMGRDAVLDEAVRASLTDWYLQAIDVAGIAPVGDPQLNLGDLPKDGDPLTFSVEIGVRPVAQLGDYLGLKVGRREPTVTDEEIDEDIDELRTRLARLEIVDRPASNGDFLIIDFVGTLDGEPFRGGEGRDQLIELGKGQLIVGFEEGLLGASAGEQRVVDVTFPEDYGAKNVAGKAAQFTIDVKDVKSKELPALDDSLADAAGFDSLDELREDVIARLREADERKVEAEYRDAVIDTIVAGATMEVTAALVEARALELWDRMTHQLSHSGLTKEAYLAIAGKTEAEVIEQAKPEAEMALRRESVIAGLIAAERIVVTDEELLDELGPISEKEGMKPEKLRNRLRSAGRLEQLLRELAGNRAVEMVVNSAVPISIEEAEQLAAERAAAAEKAEQSAAAREKLIIPGESPKKAGKKKAAGKKAAKAKEGEDPKLWTPGS